MAVADALEPRLASPAGVERKRQRGAKLQPGGRRRGSTGEPPMTRRRGRSLRGRSAASGAGTLARSAFV